MTQSKASALDSRKGEAPVHNSRTKVQNSTYSGAVRAPDHPNSQFGIGVLSYFMLADDFEVETCRMDREGRPGESLHAAISGSGNLSLFATIPALVPTPGDWPILAKISGNRWPLFSREISQKPHWPDELAIIVQIWHDCTREDAHRRLREAGWTPPADGLPAAS